MVIVNLAFNPSVPIVDYYKQAGLGWIPPLSHQVFLLFMLAIGKKTGPGTFILEHLPER